MVNWFQNLEQSHFGTGTQMATQKKKARLGGYESKFAWSFIPPYEQDSTTQTPCLARSACHNVLCVFLRQLFVDANEV